MKYLSKILLFPVEHVEVTEEDFLSGKCPVQRNLSWREKMSSGENVWRREKMSGGERKCPVENIGKR